MSAGRVAGIQARAGERSRELPQGSLREIKDALLESDARRWHGIERNAWAKLSEDERGVRVREWIEHQRSLRKSRKGVERSATNR